MKKIYTMPQQINAATPFFVIVIMHSHLQSGS